MNISPPARRSGCRAERTPVSRRPLLIAACVLASVAAAGSTGCCFRNRDTQVRVILQEQAAAWNRGSVDDFMRYYVRGPELTFSSGGQVQRGWETTRDRFRRRYPDRAAMGKLTFDQLETQELGPEHALTLGRWRLDRESGEIGGAFSLVWRREGGAWRILHDHTTQDTPP